MDLKVYSTRWCSDCRVAKAFLDKHGVSYEEIDIGEDPEAAEELVRSTGKRAVPQFLLNGRWVQAYEPKRGFLFEEMKQLLGLSPDQPVLAAAPDAPEAVNAAGEGE
jgi:mycoredoxin